MLNSDEPTYYQSSSGIEILLDMFLCESESISLVDDCYVGPDIGTDHMPVILSITPEICHPLSWNAGTDKGQHAYINWKEFSKSLNELVSQINPNCMSQVDAEHKLEEFSTAFNVAKERSTSFALPKYSNKLPLFILNIFNGGRS